MNLPRRRAYELIMETFIKKIDLPEHILCSAIWFNDGFRREHMPVNTPEGLVVCGLRHCNCIAILSEMFPDRRYIKNHVQGFLTSKNRFVDRIEGWKIALAAGQVLPEDLIGSQLFSENLW